MPEVPEESSSPALDFIRARVADDVAAGKNGGQVITRFPPEPNGYLHIGHAKAICVNWAIAQENAPHRFHLRFDDTNPVTEETVYVEGIQRDIRWLGCDWGEHLYFTSDYFEALYQFAIVLIEKGLAFVEDRGADEIRASQGTLTEPGTNSPHRDRPASENLDLFRRMRAGEFDEGSRVLRAKIDMASSVLTMRDPILYRIQKKPHHRTGTEWPIYPMYDFAHCLSDALEGITHSLCSIEFVDHRPLYDWIVEKCDAPNDPKQIEFARLNVSHTVTSKRVLRHLVENELVAGWDDPRMPTLVAMRRRGYPPEAIRDFVDAVGIGKRENTIELARLEFHVRQVLNRTAPRYMAVMRPLKVVIENFPEEGVPDLEAVNNPEDPSAGTRKVPFGRELYIERDDFMEDPPKKFHRLYPGSEVRLRYAYFITCTDVVKDADGEIVEVRATFDPATRGGDAPDGRKVKGTLHWVAAETSVPAELRLYGTLFSKENPMDVPEGGHFTDNLTPDSLEVLTESRLEPALAELAPGTTVQFERQGYFCVDPDGEPGRPVFNRTVTLRDSWAKVAKNG